jgi:hypothetical protein
MVIPSQPSASARGRAAKALGIPAPLVHSSIAAIVRSAAR